MHSFEYLLHTASSSQWKRIGMRKCAGVLVPLAGMYSSSSIGMGDLSDLKLVIDWARKTGNSIIQLLPMNELGSDFCPYDSMSSFALEPLYLSLRDLPGIKSKPLARKIAELKKLFPAGTDRVDYRFKKYKLEVLKDIFSQDSEADSAEFNAYMEKEAYWLSPFACFKVLKEYHGGKAWFEWEERFKFYDKETLERFCREHEAEVLFQIWMQWRLFKQFSDVKRYALSVNVLLKGDLPILVSRDSADVWANPEFFKLDFAAGAPPDMYCAKGQRWGMPTYNWEAIAQDGYEYLKAKLVYANNFYDIVRVDHVVGLFRIWTILYHDQLENQGLNGFFDPRDESVWGEQGRRLLERMLSASEMLLCAEDLGVIPKVCIETLKQLGVPGNDVQRWVKEWDSVHDFLSPDGYRDLSVSMLSTHDTTNWAAWWENEAGTVDEMLLIRKCYERGINYHAIKPLLFDANRSRHGRLRWLNAVDSVDKLVRILGKQRGELNEFVGFYLNSFGEKEKLWAHLGLDGAMREKSDSKIVAAALSMTLDSKAIFCIQLITDWLYVSDVFAGDAYQYRINTPGTTGAQNWSLVMPISIDDLLQHPVNDQIQSMIAASGR